MSTVAKGVLMALIRWILGALILFLDRLTAPQALTRPPEQQRLVDQSTEKLKLYQFEACPFCVKVRREVRRLGLNIEMRDVRTNPSFAKELNEGGGQYQVPCLRIEQDAGQVQWMYESSDIIQYLNDRFKPTV